MAGLAALIVALPPAVSAMPGHAVKPVGSLAGVTRALPGEHSWLTLVTGDRVLVDLSGGRERVVMPRPGKGRDGVRFVRHVEGGDTYVIPSDALPLVAARRVDRRLFNVSKLVRLGYDDRSENVVPLIVTYQEGMSARSAESRLTAAGGRTIRDLPSVDGGAVTVVKTDAGRFWESVTGAAPHALSTGITRILLDARVTATLDRSVAQVGAPAAWEAGHTGKGATVAVLDTGIDVDHPDLADAVVGAKDFTDSESGTDDLFGHGTHVAGTITGNGASAANRYVGVAPDSKLLNGKVLDDFGGGAESGVIAGMQWAVEQGADVVNMSLGSDFPGDGTDPLDQAVNELSKDSGTLFVVAAGNTGPESKSIGSPGSADEALTVGAVDEQDALADFSSRGPRWYSFGLKPDITAPGVGIVAPLAEGSVMGEEYPHVDGNYVALSGTSMAAPHVAGAAAILAGQHPGWDVDELKPALMGSAKPRDDLGIYEQGSGRLDVARAVSQTVLASPATVNNGIVRWPHTDDKPITTTIMYRNHGTTPVTLRLSASARDPQGEPAPAGMFTLDQAQVTVPAAGTATVALVTNTAVPAPDGSYGGVVVATDEQTTVRTPFGVVREVESYDVTVIHLDRDGQPTPNHFSRFVDVDHPEVVGQYDPSGKVTVRVPKGRHYFDASIDSPSGTAMAVEPELTVTRDMELVVDARQAQPVGVTVDQPDARVGSGLVLFDRKTAWGDTGFGLFDRNFDKMFVRPSSTRTPKDQSTFLLTADLGRPDDEDGFSGSPYLYRVQWSEAGRVPAELVRRIHDRDLATVETRIAAASPGQTVLKDFLVELVAPATITERYTPGIPFSPTLGLPSKEGDGAEYDGFIMSTPVTYQRGRPVVEYWNRGVFGPGFPDDPSADDPYVWRTGDTITADLQLFGDQANNRYGWSKTDSLRMTLFRDGKPIGETQSAYGEFRVPAEPGTYRLEVTASRSVSTLSTRIDAAWTFRSAHTPEDAATPLPAMAVRFAPDLSTHNQAPGGGRFAVPVLLQRQTGAGYGSPQKVTVQVSYDDGRTWQPARITGSGPNLTMLVDHSPEADHVSLRATATDSTGNSVDQTIIRAYAIENAR
ncbi:S8 family serine peptidase [Plantactinospora sonchi]|uniref:S8 family serine peptidase n=1 Tax=Plantactinospora sonchi TaxID=1544735 RepID=A0ABU7S242_9ACTN